MGRLEGFAALISGAARGIGEGIARAYLAEGATVMLTDIRDEQGVALAHTLGPRATYRKLDVRREDDWASAMEALVHEYGKLDVVVNNAGITGFENGVVAHDPEHVSLEDWRAVLATNLEGTLLGCKYAIRTMKRQGTGSIINISSRSGLVGIPGAAAYAASKAAVRSFARTAVTDLKERGIRVNVLSPGPVDTPILSKLGIPADARKDFEAGVAAAIPLGHLGQADELARAALFLVSSDSSFITGVNLAVDGGISLT